LLGPRGSELATDDGECALDDGLSDADVDRVRPAGDVGIGAVDAAGAVPITGLGVSASFDRAGSIVMDDMSGLDAAGSCIASRSKPSNTRLLSPLGSVLAIEDDKCALKASIEDVSALTRPPTAGWTFTAALKPVASIIRRISASCRSLSLQTMSTPLDDACAC